MSSFPPGKYYVGDLCYAIADEYWDKFCELTITGYDVLDGEFPWQGKKLYSHHTAYGDGCYFDEQGREYAVDAGLIGVLPADLITKTEYGDFEGLAHIIEFKRPFEPYYEKGKFYIGDIVIDTDPPYEEDDDVDYDSDDE